MKNPLAAVIILFLVLIAGAAYYFGYSNKGEESAGALVLYGNVEPREVTLSFRVPGRIAFMIPEEGDRLEKGALAASLEKTPYENQLRVGETQIKEIEAKLANAEKNFQRLASLLRRASAPQSDYDDALALRDELKAALETGKAQLAVARTSLDDADLFAPSGGTVSVRVREPGEMVAAGDAVYVLSLDSPVWVRAYVDEPDLGRIRPGMEASVRTDSGGSFRGRIGFISPSAEFTPKSVETPALRTSLVYRLRIFVAEPADGLRHGMPVTVEVDAAAGPAPAAASAGATEAASAAGPHEASSGPAPAAASAAAAGASSGEGESAEPGIGR
ncbi:MAG: efflux RND transporter periplasmic adaptor subunit [Deltaproteobacteria bacterium]|jgi:HlyD family secretion protein|nr:efflux RND transporter periplasmic adaptor subunit [Deltaproteobacteria bacterium]